MTRIALATALVLSATAAAAGQLLDRAQDLRLNTSQSTSSHAANLQAPVVSTSGKTNAANRSYAYQSAFGVGPHNDSR
jgi:hypothetical protein